MKSHDIYKLKIISLFSYLLLIPIVFYFKFFPTIWNSSFTNFFIVSLLISLFSLLIYGIFFIKNASDVFFLLPQSILIVLISRALPNLRLFYPPLQDPYYHFVCTLNILNYGTLEPIYKWWYGGIDLQLHWPMMHLISVSLYYFTDISLMQIFRFQESILSGIFFLAIFILSKEITNSNAIAILSGFFAAFNESTIGYQSEYHPQGLAFIYFVLMVHLYIKSRSDGNGYYSILTLIMITAFVLSHHFSALFIGILSCTYILLFLLFYSIYSRNKNTKIDVQLNRHLLFWIILTIFALTIHVFVFSKIINEFLISFGDIHMIISTGQFGNSLFPRMYLFFSYFKWIPLILSTLSIAFIIKSKELKEIYLVMIVVCTLLAGIAGTFISFSPLDRFIGFYISVSCILASLTIFRFKSMKSHISIKNTKVIFLVILILVPVTGAFFNSQSPAFFFQESKINTFYWYSNRLPSMEEYKYGCEWIGLHLKGIKATFGTEFDTKTPLFYFGKIPIDYIHKATYINQLENNYTVINQNIPYKNINKNIYNIYNKIYHNKEITIYGAL